MAEGKRALRARIYREEVNRPLFKLKGRPFRGGVFREKRSFRRLSDRRKTLEGN